MFKVFDEYGTDKKNDRRIFDGRSTGIINLNNVRYDWAIQLWRSMRENFWIAERIDLSMDVIDYNQLTVSEKRGFDGILAFLVFLDSVQVQNIPHITEPCTAPEVSLCFGEQLSQEQLHAQSYQYLIESIIPADRRNEIYDYWREDKILLKRCKLIGGYYQQYIDNPSSDNYFETLVADYLLEGCFFYMGFIFFYNLASRSLMSGSADVFRLINRDELYHVRLYQKLLEYELTNKINQSPYIEKIYAIFRQGIDTEIEWNCHIINNDVLGITHDSIKEYVKYLGNLRLKAIGLEPIFGEAKNPFKHLEKTADTSNEANMKVNFFDATVSSYQMSSAIEGWEDF